MTPTLRALSPGHYVTIQDTGRRGWRRFGVSGAGAMDLMSFHIANVLAGNQPGDAALEFAHVGGTWEVAADSCRIAVTGGDFTMSVDGAALAPWRSHVLRRGQRLWIEGARDAVWGYLAVAGGFDIAPKLGSRATHLRSGLGGLGGRRVGEGDEVPLRAMRAPDGPDRAAAAPDRAAAPMRVVMGPQQDYFTPEVIRTFLAAPWRVTHRGDRMGVWLEGPRLTHANGHDLVSDGLVPGCIQIPGGGQPVVLLMDCQTMGGYPKLATIVSADLPRFAQTRPGVQVTFVALEMEAAHRAYRDYRARLDRVEEIARFETDDTL